MSLTVGELSAIIKLDDKQFTPAIDKTGAALAQTGKKMQATEDGAKKLELALQRQKIEHGLLKIQIDKQGDSTGLLKNKLATLEHTIGTNETKLKGMRTALASTDTGLDNVANAAKKTDAQMSGLHTGFSKLTKMAATFGITLGAAWAAGKIGSLVQGSIKAASDLNESMSKSTVVFGASAKTVEAFGNTAAVSLGMSKQAAIESAATLGNLLVSLKLPQQAAADMSLKMVALAGDLSSFNNVPTADALEAIRAGLVGETEPLRRFGVNLTDADLRQKAMAMGLTNTTTQVLPPAIRTQAAYALILEQTTTAQGDFARTSDALANSQRSLSAQWADMKATIGAALLPLVVKMLPGIKKFVADLQIAITDAVATGDWGGVGTVIGQGIEDGLANAGPYILRGLWGLITGTYREVQKLAGLGWMDPKTGIAWAESIGKATSAAQSHVTPLIRDMRALANAQNGVVQMTTSHLTPTILAMRDAVMGVGASLTGTTSAIWMQRKALLDGADATASFADQQTYLGTCGQFAGDVAKKLAGENYTLAVAASTATSKIAAQALKMQDLNTVTDALSAAHASMVNPGTIWDEAKGKLASYLKLMREHVASYKNFQSNVLSIAKEYGSMPGYADAIRKAMQAPDAAEVFAELKKGTPAQVKEYLDGVYAQLQAENPVWAGEINDALTPKASKIVAAGIGAGTAGGTSTASAMVASFIRTWHIPTVKYQVESTVSVSQMVANFIKAWHIPTVYAHVQTIGIGGATPHAAGGTFTTPHIGLVAEAGAETIIPWSKPARAKEVMQEAGISGDNTETNALLRTLIGATQQLQNAFRYETDRRLDFAHATVSR